MKGTAYRFDKIKRARQRSGLEVKHLAEKASITTMSWWRLENGRGTSLGVIIRACDLLALDWREIIVSSRAREAA